jgi:hypothetical protein
VRENAAAPRARTAVSMSRPMLAYSAAQGKKASELLGNAAWVQAVREELGGGVVAWQPVEGNLSLVLATDPFNVMEEGEKLVEYRDNTPYWRTRLLQKDGSFRKFKEVEFSLGYQTNRRKFRARVDHMAYVDHVHESYSERPEASLASQTQRLPCHMVHHNPLIKDVHVLCVRSHQERRRHATTPATASPSRHDHCPSARPVAA